MEIKKPKSIPKLQLTFAEIEWIKLCKCHYEARYPVKATNWIETLKPMFKEIYGYSPDEHPQEFLDCMFNKLLDIYLKIKIDNSGTNQQLKEIFHQSFYQSIRRTYDLPIERAIAELCGLIQCNQVVMDDGVVRYEL